MKRKLPKLALGVLLGMLTLCAFILQANAAETAYTDQVLEQIHLPQVLGSGTFTWEDVSFHRVTIPRLHLGLRPRKQLHKAGERVWSDLCHVCVPLYVDIYKYC